MRALQTAPTRPAPPLREFFSPCPVCKGTTTMEHFPIAGRRSLGSLCQSCDSRWDLQGNPVHKGQITRLPNVDNLHLPCNNFEGCSSRRPRSHGGRPAGSRDSQPRKRKFE